MQLCLGCLTFWYFHVSALFRLAEYDSNAQLEAVIEAYNASLAIEYPIVMEDSLDIYDGEDKVQSPELKISERISESSKYKASIS